MGKLDTHAFSRLAYQYAPSLHHVDYGLSGGTASPDNVSREEKVDGGQRIRFYNKSALDIDCSADQITERACPGV